MEFLTDNKLTAPVADSVDTDFQATNILKRRLWEKYKSAALTKGDTVTIDFTAEDWEGFSDDLKEEAEAGLTNRYKLNAETGATAEDSIGTDDVTLTAGVWEDTLPTNSRWMAGATGTVPTIIDNVQTVATVCFDEWWNDKVAASYQFREGNETLDSGYGQHDLTSHGTPTYGPGPWGLKYKSYDGSADYDSIPAFLDFGTGGFTLEIVFKMPTQGATSFILSQRDAAVASGGEGFYVYVSGTNTSLSFGISDGTVGTAVTGGLNTAIVTDDLPHVLHIVINRDEGIVHGFIDGDMANSSELDISGITGAITAQGNFTLAATNTGSVLAEVDIALAQPIYTALSADDVLERFNLLTGVTARTEETKAYGPIDGNQSAAFHGGVENLANADQDLTAWTATHGTVAAVNDNYKGYPLYSIVDSGGVLVESPARVVSNTACFVSIVIEPPIGCYIYFIDSTAGASRGYWGVSSGAFAGSSFDDYGMDDIGDGKYLLWGVLSSGITSGNSHIIRINDDGTEWDASTGYFGLPLISPGAQRVPFNLNSSAGTAHNETGIPFYPRNGMVIEAVVKNAEYTASHYPRVMSWLIDSANYLDLYYDVNSRYVMVYYVRSSVARFLIIQLPAGYENVAYKIEATIDITSQSSGQLIVRYGYNIETETYVGTANDTTWSSDPSSTDISDFTSSLLAIGARQSLTSNWAGDIYSLSISHPDDPTYYFKREWNDFDYVEKPNLFEGAMMRHVYCYDEFKTKEALDQFTTYPEGIANPATRIALLGHNLTGRDTVTLKTSTGVHLIDNQDLITNDDPCYIQLSTAISRFSIAQLEITAGRDKTLELGWAFLGAPLEFSYPDYGTTPTHEDNDIVTRSWSGAAYVDRGITLRTQPVTIRGTTRAEWDAFIEYWESALRKEPGLFIMTEGNLDIYEPFFAIMNTYSPISRTNGYRYPFSVVFKEAR